MNDDNVGIVALEAFLEMIGVDTPLEELAASFGSEDQVDEVNEAVKMDDKVYLINVRQLEAYPDQPFKEYPKKKLAALAEDIGREGILHPILVREREGKWQILSGHNRWAAAKLAGLTKVPVIVLEADDDQAALIVTGTNLQQREKLLPSEKAFAYKMQMDALKRQGQQNEGGYRAADFITEQTGDSRKQIHRFVRLCQLDPGLLELLDKGRISMTPAVAVSYLTGANQAEINRQLRDLGAKLDIERANLLKNLGLKKDGEGLNNTEIREILMGTVKKKAGKIKLDCEKFQKYLPHGADQKAAEAYILKALCEYENKKNK